MKQRNAHRGGFALPTVLIASIVMLSVLTVAVSSVAAVRTSLKTQYYEQLAKVAGEAGVAYAKACLAKNSNVALWTNAKPLKPNTDCSGNDIAGITCPGDERCAVTVSGNARSSFSVVAPTVNAEGKAITIPNSGYVELLRASNGQVWRTYQQPAVQVAVVPDLCSGAAASGLGWANAVAASSANSSSIADATTATTITRADSPLPAGQMYFRRDFPVVTAGTHTVTGLTNSSKDVVELYVDGTYVTTARGSSASATIDLSAGCHTVTARLTNKTVAPSYSQFTAAVNLQGSNSPVVATDSSWRVSSGASVSFASTDFYADTDIWAPVTTYGSGYAQQTNTSWAAYGDAFSALISPSGNGCPTACPGGSTSYLRDSKDFYLNDDTYVTAAMMCDNACALYLDGQLVLNASLWPAITAQSFTIPRGYHRVGIQLYNDGTSASSSGVAMSITPSGGNANTVITRTDTSWVATSGWRSGIVDSIFAYEGTFSPSPKDIASPVTADVLVVGGGGGGGRNAAGGGGSGGVRLIEDFPLAVRTYSVTIGAGGAGSTSSSVVGSSGGLSVFGDYGASGGGGGASRDGGSAATSGGSGGGGSGASAAARTVAGNGTPGQGNRGGAGTTADSGTNSSGGGGGGAGNVGMWGIAGGDAGAGGTGRIFYLTGSRLSVGGGGAGGLTVNGTAGVAIDGGGGGSLSTPGTAGSVNTGGGGGGGGAGGGAGGSGLVIVRFKKNTATVNATGTYTTTEVTVKDVVYTVYRFTGNGNFVVSALSP